MTETILILTITHTKPLPEKAPLTDVVGQRVYSYLYANGCEAGVKVTKLTEADRRREAWEKAE